MKDLLGNAIKVGDAIAIPMKEGRTANIRKAVAVDLKMRKQFAEGEPVPMVQAEYSRIHKYWMPAKRVIALPDSLLPDKRRENLDGVEEGVQVS